MLTTLLLATAAQLAALQPIVGNWHSAEPAEKTDVTSRCAWSPAHQFVICDQEGTFQGKPFTALSIYGWSEAKKGYIFYGAQNGGDPSSTELQIEGKTWTYVPGAGGQWKTTNEFLDRDTYEFKVFHAEDGKTWKVVSSGRSKRVK